MKRISLLTLSTLVLSSLFGQNQNKIEPIYPRDTPGLLYWEAEDAVATNFNKEPTLDYRSSGHRTLILNNSLSLYEGTPYFAQYVVYVPEAGNYEFWFGGTPPGPKDELKASFASPLSLVLDDKTVSPLYRENVNVVETYSPTEYWSRMTTPLKLTAGTHTIRLEVSEKRRYDAKFYFNLDALFLLKTPALKLSPDILPDRFPKDLNNRSIDTPYLSFAQYEAQIQAKPNQLTPLLEISQVYSMIGDYQDALKYLTRARVLEPDNTQILLLTAKNKIWSGETDEGIQFYKTYLEKSPKDADVWAEVSKIQAWLGKYQEAIETYTKALTQIPDELNLTVNLGLTYLWANRIQEGENTLAKAWKLVGLDSDRWKNLGGIFEDNGYRQKAIEVYRKATKQFAPLLEFYLMQQETLSKNGQDQEAAAIRKQIVDTFIPSDRLTGYLSIFDQRINLKEQVLADFRTRLKASPDDLRLREMFIESLFWNGRKNDAIQEHVNILVNHLYHSVGDFERDSYDLFKALDERTLTEGELAFVKPSLTKAQADLSQAWTAWQNADRTAHQWADAAKAKPLGPEDQKTREKADAELKKSQENLLALFISAQATTDFVDKVVGLAKGGQSQIDALLLKGGDDAVRLAKLAGPKNWLWDREGTLYELTQSSRSGVALADYVLARIALVEGRFADTAKTLSLLKGREAIAQADALNFQAKFWQTPTGDLSGLPSPYYNYGPLLSAEVQTIQPKTRGWGDDLPLLASELLKGFAAKLHDIETAVVNITKEKAGLRDAALTRLKITFFSYDSAMISLRYQLGEDNINANNLEEAKRQLRKVLQMDPWNTRARFRLGNVSQMLGEWNEAVNQYKDVFQTDPKFESAASLHNQVAREHPDRFDSQVRIFSDSQRNVQEGQLVYRKDLNSRFGVESSLVNTQTRLYDGGQSGVTAATLKIPFFLGPWKLQTTPFVGGLLNDTSLFVTSNSAQSPLSWLGNQKPSLQAGVGLNWQSDGPVSADATYTYGPVADTLADQMTVFLSHTAEVSISTYFALPSPSVLNSISTRTYGREQLILNDSNILTTAVQDLIFTFHVADAPWTNLSLTGNAIYDGSSTDAPTNSHGNARYYSPGGNVIVKGGLSAATWIGIPGGSTLGLSARGAWGPYWQNLMHGTSGQYVTWEAGSRLEWTKGDWTFFLDVSGSDTTDASGGTTYWSGQGILGFHLAVPNYLLPQ